MSILELQRLSKRRNQTYQERLDNLRRFVDASVALVGRLPFKTTLVGASNPRNNQSGHNYAATHIVLGEPINKGRLTREPGDALCKPYARFNGNLWATTYQDDVANCTACLRAAERLAGEKE